MSIRLRPYWCTFFALGFAAPAVAAVEGKDTETMIQQALSAAPAAIAKEATVMDWENHELRHGTNGWTCFPDMPRSPGPDPMCLDRAWMDWADAWMNKRDPVVTGMGISYMLQGGSDASNSDPFATEPAPGSEWLDSGPHIMVLVPDRRLLDTLPTDPHSGGPWVMWKGTPYAHVMVPVASP